MRTTALRPAAALLAVLALAGCGGAVPAPRTGAAAVPAPTRVVPQDAAPFRRAERMNLPGLEEVIGMTQAALVRRFGAPRLDIHEGDARKLQFSGSACVLDVYLYPPAPRSEPEADYVDARLPDGRDTDRARCVAALRKP